LLFLVPPISQTHKSLENSQDFFVKTKTMTKTFTSRPRPRPRLYFFVLEAPRDQDFGLEDYITAQLSVCHNTNATSRSTNSLETVIESALSFSQLITLISMAWRL